MAKFGVTLLLVAFLVGPSSAFRTRNTVAKSEGGLDDVQAFLEAATALGKEGEVAGQLAMNLESGVEATIVSSTLSNEDNVVSLEVVHSQTNQGEIATPSKVPVLWTLDETTYYEFSNFGGKWQLSVRGIKLLPFSEGKDMYMESGVAAACDAIKDAIPKVQCERKALLKWYAKKWSAFKKSAYKDYNTNPTHKLGRILAGMYGSTSTYYAVSAGGGGAWEKIIYSLVTIPPVAIEYFVITSKASDIEIAMVAQPALEGVYGGVDLADYDGLHFSMKNSAEFDANAFESQRSSGEVFARSGMNFGAMVAKGQHLDDERVRGGSAKYILNFASPCTKRDKKDGNNDPTDGCRDANGRVFWQ